MSRFAEFFLGGCGENFEGWTSCFAVTREGREVVENRRLWEAQEKGMRVLLGLTEMIGLGLGLGCRSWEKMKGKKKTGREQGNLHSLVTLQVRRILQHSRFTKALCFGDAVSRARRGGFLRRVMSVCSARQGLGGEFLKQSHEKKSGRSGLRVFKASSGAHS